MNAVSTFDQAGQVTASRPRIAAKLRRVIQFTIEMALIAILGLTAAHGTLVADPTLRVRGSELSYLTFPGLYAGEIFRETGSIPLWNTLLGNGEPLVEHAFSFVLNPFMVGPFLALESSETATKVAVAIHIVLIGIAGWLAAYSLRVKAPARILAGGLCIGLGNFVAAIGGGFYSMSLSQVYMVFTIAGLIGVLYGRGRWPVGLFAVGAALLLFAGTYWYVLPTAIAGLILTAFAVPGRWMRREHGQWVVDARHTRRYGIAIAFLVGLCAIRLLPEIATNHLSSHPTETFADYISLYVTLQRYVVPVLDDDIGWYPHMYHYSVPLALLAGLILLRFGLIRSGRRQLRWRWRIYAPALISVLLFAVWAQVSNPVFMFLYERIPLLGSWRFLERMQAAGTIWLVLIVTLMFDDCWQIIRPVTGNAVSGGAQLFRVIRIAVCIVMIAAAALAINDVRLNWDRVAGVEPIVAVETNGVVALREAFPGQTLPIATSSFFGYFDFPTYMARAWTGNPDYRPVITPTVGSLATGEIGRFKPPFGVSNGENNWDSELLQNMQPFPPAPAFARVNPEAVAFAFAITESVVDGLSFSQTPDASNTAALSYVHRIDQVEVRSAGVATRTAVAILETAFPGWNVSINGEPRRLESVYGYAGVWISPEDGDDVHVVFTYQPFILSFGAIITVITAAVLSGYLLAVDVRVRQVRQFLRHRRLPRLRRSVAPQVPAVVPDVSFSAAVTPMPFHAADYAEQKREEDDDITITVSRQTVLTAVFSAITAIFTTVFVLWLKDRRR